MSSFNTVGKIPYSESEELIRRVAWMYYEDDLNQQEIADKLKLSRTKVLRLLKTSRDSGFVKISLDIDFSMLLDLERKLCQLAGLKECLVVPTGRDPLATAAKGLSYRFNLALRSNRSIGVGSGRTLYTFAKELDPTDKIVTKEVVSVIGNTKPNLAIEPFDIAASLAAKLPVEFFQIWGPSSVSTPQEAELLRGMPAIKTVLQKAENVDVAFVGIGDMQNTSFVRYGYLGGDELKRVVDAGMIGEVLGRFYDIDGKSLDEDVNSLFLSIRLPIKGDMIGVAAGAEKVNPIIGCLRTGWLNGLVTDEATAKALIKILNREARR